MNARYACVEALLEVGGRTAMQTALDILLDILRLDHCNSMRVHSLIPALYLRLGRDQEFYDYLAWWHNLDRDEEWRASGVDMPHLRMKHVDPFAPVEFNIDLALVTHGAMLCLFKWRLCSDLRSLTNLYTISGDRLPTELFDQICCHMPTSMAIQKNKSLMEDIAKGKDISYLIDALAQETTSLFTCVHKSNEVYWTAVVEPRNNTTTPTGQLLYYPISELPRCLEQTHQAWIETPGAMEWLQGMIASELGSDFGISRYRNPVCGIVL